MTEGRKGGNIKKAGRFGFALCARPAAYSSLIIAPRSFPSGFRGYIFLFFLSLFLSRERPINDSPLRCSLVD